MKESFFYDKLLFKVPLGIIFMCQQDVVYMYPYDTERTADSEVEHGRFIL